MPQVGEKGPGGKIWTGSDYGWQSPSTVWKSQKPGGKVGETRTVPGGGSKVWTGKDYGWQTQATIDKTKKGTQPAPSPTPAPKPTSPAPAPAPAPSPAPAPAPAPKPTSPAPAPTSAPAPKPTSSASASTAEKIKGGLETYKKQVASGDVKGAEATGKSTWALANPKLAAAAAERERTRGTSASTNPQMADLKSRLPAPKVTPSEVSTPPDSKVKTDTAVQRVQAISQPAAQSIDAEVKKRKIPTFNTSKMTTSLNQSYEYDAYDIVLEYLLSTGHAKTVIEAAYIMTEMDSEMIQNIVEGGVSFPIEHEKAETERSKKIRSAADSAVPNAERKYKGSGGGPVMFPVKGV